MDFTAKLIQKLPLQEGQGKNGPWKKQDVIFETDGQYPKKICVSVWGDRINMADFKEEDKLTVFFDLESREYNGKWYSDIRAWKIEASTGATAAPAPANTYSNIPNSAPQPSQTATSMDSLTLSEGEDDLPF